MLRLLYCPHCRRRAQMVPVEETGQSDWQKRPFFERTYCCRRCGRKVNTIEILADDVYEYDHLRRQMDKIFERAYPLREQQGQNNFPSPVKKS